MSFVSKVPNELPKLVVLQTEILMKAIELNVNTLQEYVDKAERCFNEFQENAKNASQLVENQVSLVTRELSELSGPQKTIDDLDLLKFQDVTFTKFYKRAHAFVEGLEGREKIILEMSKNLRSLMQTLHDKTNAYHHTVVNCKKPCGIIYRMPTDFSFPEVESGSLSSSSSSSSSSSGSGDSSSASSTVPGSEKKKRKRKR